MVCAYPEKKSIRAKPWWCRSAISSVAMSLLSSDHSPSHSRSSSSSCLLPSGLADAPSGGWRHLFEQSVEKNDPLWKDYIKEAAVFDNRMIDEWNKIIDAVLVYVSPGYFFWSLLVTDLQHKTVGCLVYRSPNCLRHRDHTPI